jgi:hypothetical protein
LSYSFNTNPNEGDEQNNQINFNIKKDISEYKINITCPNNDFCKVELELLKKLSKIEYKGDDYLTLLWDFVD